MNSVERTNQIAREFDKSEKEAQRRLDKDSGLKQELKALRAENEQLKKLLAEVKADIETAELGEGYEYNLRLILDKIKALKG